MQIKINEKNLTITSQNPLTINEIVDLLENFQFTIQKLNTSQNNYEIEVNKPIKNKELFTKILKNALLGKIPKKCKLYYFYQLDFSLKEINFLRVLAIYQSQIMKFSYEFIINTYIKYSSFIKNPSLEIDTDNQSEHQVLLIFREIKKNIIKTNLEKNKETIAFKIDIKNFKHLLKGINPNIESFVYHNDFCGVHLRMSKISRGGIRYSQRVDFREEIKDLMTTQQYKNAIIIPNGGKGGFFIFDENPSREKIKKCYSLYIDALLDLVDFEYGEDKDFYFVVAADKGTSDFSDIANEIAIKRGYFFKDAFASGGKNGYSHKKLGITALGALTSANRHFLEINKNIFKDEISVVGVGSMRGDVFGNGMLMNENFKLIAAISSKEIFIDPNPDIKKSFLERKRLFENSLSWKHYEKKALSKGAAIFDRSKKTQKISKEIQKLINHDSQIIQTDKLIKKLLKLKVDMLYFGAIGTYVKASEEINELISDKQNANIRIDANEIKAFCVCEGANLAMTNKARVEYSQKGRINLDAIDNSAGVNISDYEVNLKLINADVLKYTDIVIKKVLTQNIMQPLRISLDEKLSEEDIKEFANTLQNVETFNEVFKTFDSIKPLRPILAILLLYTKLFIKEKIDFFDEKYLKEYFPLEIDYEKHILKKEIAKTVITNKVVNLYGLKILKNFSTQKIINILILNEVLNLEKIKEEALNLEIKKQYKILELIDDIITLNIDSSIEKTDEKIINDLDDFIKNQNRLKFISILLKISQKTGKSLRQLQKIYSQINAVIKLEKILNQIKNIKTKSKLEEEMKYQTYKNFQIFLYNSILYSLNHEIHPKNFINPLELKKHKSIFYYNYLSNELLLNSLKVENE